MILTLAWKEYREHRAIWLTMAIMTCVMGFGLVQLVATRDTEGSRLAVQALAILGMSAAYGVVCGGMMFAGEREAGTLVFLDIFLGRRGLLWFWKCLIGVVLVVTEALAVGLTLHLLEQAPALWLPMIVGIDIGPGAGTLGTAPFNPDTTFWLVVLPAVTLETYAWGLLGSTLTRRVLSGAGLAVLMMAPFWLLTIFAPPGASFIIRMIGAGLALLFSLGQFLTQSRDTPLGAAPRSEGTPALKRLAEEFQASGKFDLERRAPELARGRGAKLAIPPKMATAAGERVRARGPRMPQAASPHHALYWLILRQARAQLAVLAGVGLLVGLLVPAFGQVLWPIVTLLLGVLCGSAAFAQEQSDLSYQFLAAQHLPLKRFWTAKIVFWLGSAVLLALVLVGGGGLLLLGKYAALPRPRPPLLEGFHFGDLPSIMGAPLFFGAWLLYGFSMGQLFVLFCRKTVLAVLLATVAGTTAMALWLPSLLCGGLSGWPVWLPPLFLLTASRLLMRAWAGGRIKDRKPFATVAVFCIVALGWALLIFTLRAWEIPDVGEPIDREAFRLSVPTARANRGGQKTLEAIGELDGPDGREGPWLRRLEAAARLPVGVIENPLSGSHELLMRHLDACRRMTAKLRAMAAAAGNEGKPDVALDRLALILHLSRTLRKKASLMSYMNGLALEADALEELELWLARKRPAPPMLRRALDELNRHAADTPGPLECLQTECYRAGDAMENPAFWSFYPRPEVAPGRLSVTWLANWVAFSLDVPWEHERRTRLWRAVWAGLFHTMKAPHERIPDRAGELANLKESTQQILQGWSSLPEGPGSSLTIRGVARLLDESWLSDERLFIPVHNLRMGALRGRWGIDACRLRLALGLYRSGEKKAATRLNDLIPRYLTELPTDPYTGRSFHYRVSRGERIATLDGTIFQGRQGAKRGNVRPGEGVLWSTGIDGVDDGGRKHAGHWLEEGPPSGFDLVTVADLGP